MGSEHTQSRLTRAAEALIAEQGVAGVSLRGIAAAAGERNTAAVNYHFGGKEELIAAILQQRMHEVDARRVDLLDRMKADGRELDLHAAVEAAVVPLGEYLQRGGEEGSAYILFLARVQDWSRERLAGAVRETGIRGLNEVLEIARRSLDHLPEEIFLARWTLAISFVTHALAELAGSFRNGEPTPTRAQAALYISDLIDMTVGMWGAPMSADTRALVCERGG